MHYWDICGHKISKKKRKKDKGFKHVVESNWGDIFFSTLILH